MQRIKSLCDNKKEQPLIKHGCCNLGSLNLSEYVKKPYTKEATFNIPQFSKDVRIAVNALDAILDENINRHPLKEQRDNSIRWRNIGLGVMGYATMLMKMGMTYGSPLALSFSDIIFKLLFAGAVDASCGLAEEKGAFPGYDELVWDSEIMINAYGNGPNKGKPLRNCSLISIAPTGSISNFLGVSGGVEPEYAISYTRKTESLSGGDPQYFEMYCTAAKEYMEVNGTDTLPEWFVSSSNIKWEDRIMTQAMMQRFVDTAISSTVNLPRETTLEEIEKLYLYAWQQKLKGITIFRDGCKRLGILTTDTSAKEDSTESATLPRGYIHPVSDAVIGKKRKLITGCGSLHCTAFFDATTGDLMETYLSKGSTGGCANFTTGLSRMISLASRVGCDIYSIVDQLNSTGVCPSYAVRSATKKDTSKGSCCPMAVGRVLLEMHDEMMREIGNGARSSSPTKNSIKLPAKPIVNPCPSCGEELIFEGGCNSCTSCGYSQCS